jgi:predicted transcriptional regulator
MRDKRSRHEVMVAILEIVAEDVNITRIVYGANINFKMAQDYIRHLTEIGLIESISNEGKVIYRITEMGKIFLKKFLELVELEFAR